MKQGAAGLAEPCQDSVHHQFQVFRSTVPVWRRVMSGQGVELACAQSYPENYYDLAQTMRPGELRPSRPQIDCYGRPVG